MIFLTFFSAHQKTHLLMATSFQKTRVSSLISGKSIMIRKFFLLLLIVNQKMKINDLLIQNAS